jgi:hypothetical protein
MQSDLTYPSRSRLEVAASNRPSAQHYMHQQVLCRRGSRCGQPAITRVAACRRA